MPSAKRTIQHRLNPLPAHPTILKTKADASVSGSGFPSATGSSSPGIGEERECGVPMATMLVPPKHVHVPDIPVDCNIMFEALACFYATICLGLQYIHLYKTVWWLPFSPASYSLNFYLIDPHLATLLIILTSRRVVGAIVLDLHGSRSPKSCLHWLVKIFKFITVVSLVSALMWAAYHVVLKYTFIYSLFLCYPLATYLILFGVNMRPLFGKCVGTTSLCNNGSQAGSEIGTPKHKAKEVVCAPYRDIPLHNCSMSPEAVREEVDVLKTDFNNRVKQVLFNSLMIAYYMSFVPVCFAQNTLYYDTWWVGQHLCLVWVSSFVMFMVHYLPTCYVDVLHRCALHLGRWQKVEGRNAHVPYTAWSELQVWQQGALVKHFRGLFKAEGINNSAEPGNSMHARFYFMFHLPMRVCNWLLVITWSVVLYQMTLLVQATEWSHIISLTMLLFCNYYVLFKLMRDRFVLSRAFKDQPYSLQ